MTFDESIKLCYKKSFVIKGRASRSEYWWFQLYFYLLILVTTICSHDFALIRIIAAILLIATIPASLTSYVRRLHDTGHSGWYILLGWIPYIGFLCSIFLLVLCCTSSDIYENEYGPCPLDQETDAEVNIDSQNTKCEDETSTPINKMPESTLSKTTSEKKDNWEEL